MYNNLIKKITGILIKGRDWIKLKIKSEKYVNIRIILAVIEFFTSNYFFNLIFLLITYFNLLIDNLLEKIKFKSYCTKCFVVEARGIVYRARNFRCLFELFLFLPSNFKSCVPQKACTNSLFKFAAFYFNSLQMFLVPRLFEYLKRLFLQ